MESITIRRPDDMHVHLREGQMLANVLPFTSRVFARAVVMGNLKKPVIAAEDALNYRQEILRQAPDFEPIMTIMLTNATTPQVISDAAKNGVKVLKLMPRYFPLESMESAYPALKEVRKHNMIFSIHAERSSSPDYQGYGEELYKEAGAILYCIG